MCLIIVIALSLRRRGWGRPWRPAVEPAFAAGPFRPFLGSWRGTGEITSQDGRKEPISCRATYETAATSSR